MSRVAVAASGGKDLVSTVFRHFQGRGGLRTKLTFYLLGVGWRVGGVGVKHKWRMWLVVTCNVCVGDLYMDLLLHTITHITLLCCRAVHSMYFIPVPYSRCLPQKGE